MYQRIHVVLRNTYLNCNQLGSVRRSKHFGVITLLLSVSIFFISQFQCALFRSALLYCAFTALFCSAVFYTSGVAMLCSTVFCCTLLCFVLFCSVLPSSTLLCSVLLYFAFFCYAVLNLESIMLDCYVSIVNFVFGISVFLKRTLYQLLFLACH